MSGRTLAEHLQDEVDGFHRELVAEKAAHAKTREELSMMAASDNARLEMSITYLEQISELEKTCAATSSTLEATTNTLIATVRERDSLRTTLEELSARLPLEAAIKEHERRLEAIEEDVGEAGQAIARTLEILDALKEHTTKDRKANSAILDMLAEFGKATLMKAISKGGP